METDAYGQQTGRYIRYDHEDFDPRRDLGPNGHVTRSMIQPIEVRDKEMRGKENYWTYRRDEGSQIPLISFQV